MLNNHTYKSFATSGYITAMTATEFEIIVAEYLTGLGKTLPDFKIKHNVYLSAHDGVYQIDVLASYTALSVSMTVLVECKRYTHPVSRNVVQVLHDKLHSTGAHKGIIFSTSGFQDGAVQYALRHKIALITLLPGKFLTVTNTLNSVYKMNHAPKFTGEYISDERLCYINPTAMRPIISDLMHLGY